MDEENQKSKTIEMLVIDDEKIICDMLVMLISHLDQKDGYKLNITTAYTEEAVRNVLSGDKKYGLVMSDYTYREFDAFDLDGEVVLKKIKEISPETITYLMSGAISSDKIQQVKAAGVREVYHKPLSLDDVHGMIKDYVSIKQSEESKNNNLNTI